MTRPRNLTPHIHGGRLVLPAAVLLGTFTHYPAVATFIQSLFSTPRGSRPARFVGGENYQAMLQDPVFWQSLENNLIFALGTIPLSIALALLMALWELGRASCRARVCQYV